MIFRWVNGADGGDEIDGEDMEEYGERKVKKVLGDGSIKAKRIAVTLQTDRTVPPSMLSCRHVDCGTCDYLTCRACLFENSADGQAERDEAEEAAAAAADDP